VGPIAGILLMSMVTSAPDFMSSVMAILNGNPDMPIGNILGSNFINLTLGFGVASLITPFQCEKKVTKVEFPLLFLLTLFFTFCCANGKLSRGEGIALLVVFCCYIFFTFAKKKPDVCIDVKNTDTGFNVWTTKKSVLVFLTAASLLAYGSNLVVNHCREIADFFKIPKIVIGFSLVALQTSAPEIFVVAMAAKRRDYTICAGNILGSSLINLMFVSGLCAAVYPLHFEKNIFMKNATALIFVTALDWYIFYKKRIFSRIYGVILVVTYLVVTLNSVLVKDI
jgi:cation:H+ antiporter